MIKNGFSKFYWGFLFIMIDFRIQGVDILPDVIGFILFAVGFSALSGYSAYYKTAAKFNVITIIVALFSIYEQPTQGVGTHINLTGFLVGMVSFIFGLVVVYNLFIGIKEMARHQEQSELYDEAGTRWTQFLLLQLAVIALFVLIFIPPLAIISIFVLLIVSVVITAKIMGFMSRCGDRLSSVDDKY